MTLEASSSIGSCESGTTDGLRVMDGLLSIPGLGSTGCAPSKCITNLSLHAPSLETVADIGMHSTAVAPSIATSRAIGVVGCSPG